MKKINNTILKYNVTKDDSGKTVEEILKKRFSISSGLFIFLKMNKKIFINDIPCVSIDVAKEGDIVSADIYELAKSEIPEYDFPIDILFEDSHILVVNKPPELSIHPCLGDYHKTLAGAVICHWRKNGENHNFHAVNRLDKNTSGICIIAKNRYSHSILCNEVINGKIDKEYSAIVHGKISNNGIINEPIMREKESVIKRIVSPLGKESITKYYPVKSNELYSLIKIKLLTGRTHQIRVHFSHIGHPLYGDWLYGDGDNEKKFIERHALCADKVSFFHPVSKEKLSFIITLPKDMNNLIYKLDNI